MLTAAAVTTRRWAQPKSVSGFEKVGLAFYPKFDDPQHATTLEVSAVDPVTLRLHQFKVEKKDGVWRIPSHYDYPAEASQRLAATATSLIGLTRESVVGRREIQHAQYGVLTPDASGEHPADSMGRRITLRDGQRQILIDYIVGNQSDAKRSEATAIEKSTGQTQNFFVRVPGEKETYRTSLKIDLSTRFCDWIHPDLLNLKTNDLRTIQFDNYRLEKRAVVRQGEMETQTVRVNSDSPWLSRGEQPDSWRLLDLDESRETMNTDKLAKLLAYLDQMAIVGVRPLLKYKGQLVLSDDFQLASIPELENDVQLYNALGGRLESELESMGFQVAIINPITKERGFVANNGAIQLTTQNGVHYSLYFGDVFVGEESSIEFAGVDPSQNTAASSETAESADREQRPALELNKNRYVAIRVSFDKSALGPPPSEPTEPKKLQKPSGYREWQTRQEKLKSAAKEKRNDDAPPIPDDLAPPSDDVFKAYETAKKPIRLSQSEIRTRLHDLCSRTQGIRATKNARSCQGKWVKRSIQSLVLHRSSQEPRKHCPHANRFGCPQGSERRSNQSTDSAGTTRIAIGPSESSNLPIVCISGTESIGEEASHLVQFISQI